jgi:multidrug efflux pump subunit AcrA (membrane-fusion protein)
VVNRRPSPRPHVFFSLVATSLAAAGLAGCQSSEPEGSTGATETAPTPVTVASVLVRPVQRRISVVGTLAGSERIVVTPKIEGLVRATHFDVGDRVPPDAILLEIDATDYQLAVDEAQRALEHELSRLDLAAPPVDPFEIEALPSVERARLLVENAQRQFDRQKSLLAKNTVTQESHDQAETDLKVAQALLRQARLDARTTLAAVRHRESILSVARQKLSETQVAAPEIGNGTPTGGSPDDGSTAAHPGQFVVARRMASVGEMVRAFPSTPVFELVADDLLKLHVMIPERYASQVRIGLEVELRVEAYPGEIFPGKVARINPTVDPVSRSFDVEARVPNFDHRLKHGGFAKAEVVVGTADRAVTIPLEAVTRFAGVSKVFRIRDESAEEVEIEVGAQGPGWIEAMGGLAEGDVVVVSGQSRLANGTRVRVREPVAKTTRE